MNNPITRCLVIASLALMPMACSAERSDGHAGDAQAATAVAATSAAGIAAQALSLKVDTFDGQHFDLADQRGQWVVVNYWATWCAPCLKEIPDFSTFDERRDDVTVIGLAYEEIESGDMRAFLEKVPASYPIAIVDVYDPPADFDPPRALPTTYLVAPDGRMAERFMGPVTSEQLAEAIRRHADG